MVGRRARAGEEEEDTVYQVRGKLFALSAQNQWKERGTGMLRLNVRRQDGSGARLGECCSERAVDLNRLWYIAVIGLCLRRAYRFSLLSPAQW